MCGGNFRENANIDGPSAAILMIRISPNLGCTNIFDIVTIYKSDKASVLQMRPVAYKLNWQPKGRKLVNWTEGPLKGISRQPMTTNRQNLEGNQRIASP